MEPLQLVERVLQELLAMPVVRLALVPLLTSASLALAVELPSTEPVPVPTANT